MLSSMPPSSHKQAYQLSDHLHAHGDISGMEATALYRITSVTKVISVLRARYGHNITAQGRYDHTGKRYVRYYLVRG